MASSRQRFVICCRVRFIPRVSHVQLVLYPARPFLEFVSDGLAVHAKGHHHLHESIGAKTNLHGLCITVPLCHIRHELIPAPYEIHAARPAAHLQHLGLLPLIHHLLLKPFFVAQNDLFDLRVGGICGNDYLNYPIPAYLQANLFLLPVPFQQKADESGIAADESHAPQNVIEGITHRRHFHQHYVYLHTFKLNNSYSLDFRLRSAVRGVAGPCNFSRDTGRTRQFCSHPHI